MKEKNKNKTRVVKFLEVLKKFWYVIVASVLCFAGMGLAFGIYKNKNKVQTVKDYNYISTKANMFLSDGNYMNFNDSFNNSCVYIISLDEFKNDVLKSINFDTNQAKISVSNLTNTTNMLQINIDSSTKEEGINILNAYIENAQQILNQNLRNNLDEGGNFKEGIENSSKIILRQIGKINQNQIQVKSEIKKSISLVIFVLVGGLIGLILSIIILYLVKFYFIIHSPVEVIKNFNIEFFGNFYSEEELIRFYNSNNYLYCLNNKSLKFKEKFYNINEILNDNALLNNEVVIVLTEDKDTLMFVEKAQTLLQNKIRGFIIYK